MSNRKVILCTGGIGSGKSFVVQIFRAMGIPAYDSDAAAKSLYDRDSQLLDAVADVAGQDIVAPDGRLDRIRLAARIFSDVQIRSRVEALVHPAVARDFDRWAQAQSSPLVLIESAILLERPVAGISPDFVVVVTAPEDVRIERICSRDSVSPEQAARRISLQWSDAQRIAKADFTVDNSGSVPLVPQIDDIVKKINNTDYGKN